MEQESGSTPILLAWSGGKDCLMALDRLYADPRWQVVGLLTTTYLGSGRVQSHAIRAEVLHAQADALGLRLFEAPLADAADNATYLAAFAAGLGRARAATPALQHIAFGDLALADVRAWREAELTKIGWQGVFPLWGEPTAALARHFIQHGHRACLTCVDSTQIDPAFAGRAFDGDLLRELPPTADPCGENGEFHTVVYSSGLFSHPLRLRRGEMLPGDERFRCIDFCLA
ncbi:MAG: ATP-binding protein [Dokdonella sp.]